jgi:NADH:ubiquinone oxidoreductase subunit K
MPEQSKSHSWPFMFAILIILLAAASAIAYGIISQYFRH